MVSPVASAYIILHTSSRPALETLERRLSAVPLGSQYYVAFRPAAAPIPRLKRGCKVPELSKLLASLDSRTRIVSAGPSNLERRFGAAPLSDAAE